MYVFFGIFLYLFSLTYLQNELFTKCTSTACYAMILPSRRPSMSSLVSGVLPDFHEPREEFREQGFPCCLWAAPGSLGSHRRPMARWSGITAPSWTQCGAMSTRHRTAGALRWAMNRNSGFMSNKLMLRREFNTKINLHVQNYVLEIKIHVHFKNTTI